MAFISRRPIISPNTLLPCFYCAGNTAKLPASVVGSGEPGDLVSTPFADANTYSPELLMPYTWLLLSQRSSVKLTLLSTTEPTAASVPPDCRRYIWTPALPATARYVPEG